MVTRQNNDHSLRPLIGVGVTIIWEGKVLLGKRKNAHGEGEWAFPGGHLEYGEDIEACARREVMEETGLTLKKCIAGPYTNNVFQSHQRHYVTLIIIAEAMAGTPENREPDKCESWEWFDWNNLPTPLFLPLESLIREQFDPIRYLM
ncbi:DNA mismatch repair protein MutT [Endozoicomonas sp. (ex Bugula neritina AB1)]|nr:DNA mismatch repair protein MutT [Endozoicomonas sp. (ex Bugula neritina AB1)]